MPEAKFGFTDIPGGASGSQLLAAHGPTLLVNIGFDPDYRGNQPSSNIPAAGIANIQALIDTGAGESCIDSLLAAQLNLPIVDRRVFGGIGGRQEVNMHLAQIYVPALRFVIYARLPVFICRQVDSLTARSLDEPFFNITQWFMMDAQEG